MVDIGEKAHIILTVLVFRSAKFLVVFLICCYYFYVFLVFEEIARDLGITL